MIELLSKLGLVILGAATLFFILFVWDKAFVWFVKFRVGADEDLEEQQKQGYKEVRESNKKMKKELEAITTE